MNNEWALILGGSSGLGLATAKKMAEDGYNLCILHRTRRADLPKFEEDMEYMKGNGIDVISFNRDAMDPDTRKEVITQLHDSSVRVVIHSIAKGSLKPMKDQGFGTLKKVDLAITLEAMGYNWYEWTSELLAANKFGKVVSNIAFTSEGNSKVWPGYGAISAAKAVLEAMMRSMAVEYASEGIRTNCIQAGVTKTPSFEMIPGSDQLAAMAAKRNPFGRITSPEDVANVVHLLCKEEALWINGSILKVDGGESLR